MQASSIIVVRMPMDAGQPDNIGALNKRAPARSFWAVAQSLAMAAPCCAGACRTRRATFASTASRDERAGGGVVEG